MRYLVFSDLHFFRGRPYLLDTCQWIAEQIAIKKPDRVVFGGDLNHAHNQVETDVFADIAKALSCIAAAAKTWTKNPLIAISGNHDTTLKTSGKNLIESLDLLSSDIYGITQPTKVEGAVFVPHPPSDSEGMGRFCERLATEAAGCSLMFSHVELQDIRYSPASSFVSDHPLTIPESIKTVVNGHYHHPDRRTVAGKDIIIIGSPCYHTYADILVDQPRGYILVDDKGNLERVENPHGPIYHTIEPAQIPAIMAHPGVSRMRLRVKLGSKEELGEHRAAIMRLREVAESVRVMGKTSEAAMEVFKAESSTLNSVDHVSMFHSYVAKKNVAKSVADVGLSFLQGAVK